ncbi:hypothetical protein Syun_026294 [Stephania yunnanensis]|uniref:Uncharacterized protein n=1 Tax=Stephania yunnanensis TaxID=152371 RepID=A0AAP0F251_9MAGN
MRRGRRAGRWVMAATALRRCGLTPASSCAGEAAMTREKGADRQHRPAAHGSVASGVERGDATQRSEAAAAVAGGGAGERPAAAPGSGGGGAGERPAEAPGSGRRRRRRSSNDAVAAVMR